MDGLTNHGTMCDASVLMAKDKGSISNNFIWL